MRLSNESEADDGSEIALAGEESLFLKIVCGSTAIGFAALFALIESLGTGPAGFSLHISLRTLAASCAGAAVGYYYWKLVMQNLHGTGTRCWLVGGVSVVMLLGGIGAFLSPLRFVPKERLHDVLVGLGCAALALSMVGFMFWRVKTFLDKDTAGTSKP